MPLLDSGRVPLRTPSLSSFPLRDRGKLHAGEPTRRRRRKTAPFRPAPRRRPPAAGDATLPPSTPTTRLLLFIATLSLLLAQTLALSSATAVAAAEPADPCAAAVSDGGSEAASCPVRCFRPDPVCGADGVTYWCGCPEAACAGARVARRGYCEVGAGSAPVSGQALLLVHIVWLFVLGAAVLLGFL